MLLSSSSEDVMMLYVTFLNFSKFNIFLVILLFLITELLRDLGAVTLIVFLFYAVAWPTYSRSMTIVVKLIYTRTKYSIKIIT